MKRDTARARLACALNMAPSRFITIAELAQAAGASYAAANRYVWQLKRNGVVREISKATGRRDGFAIYMVARETEQPAAKITARERLWRAIRIRRRFTIEEIRITAGASKNNALKYVLALTRAGYLRMEVPRRSGKLMGGAIYAIARDNGVSAPQMLGQSQ